MMRIMLRIRSGLPDPEGPEDPNPVEEYMTETNSLLKKLREKHHWARWDKQALSQVHSWAGHVARFQAYAPHRWALRALTYRNIQYLHKLDQMTGSQCHVRRFRVWRWEQQFSRHYGPKWMQETLDNEQWADSREQWLMGRHSWTKQ